MSLLIVVFVFFFQAEDGIRDVAVTGVQTCALPISQPLNQLMRHGSGERNQDDIMPVDAAGHDKSGDAGQVQTKLRAAQCIELSRTFLQLLVNGSSRLIDFIGLTQSEVPQTLLETLMS